MRRLVIKAHPGTPAPVRIALMPGAYQHPEEFEREGFAAAVQARGLSIDLEFIAIDLKHVLDRSVLDALRREVIAPARQAGCREIWLGGTSLGAYLALVYAEQWLEDLDGLCLFAPYLGNRAVTGEVAKAGGVRVWRPAAIEPDDEERRVWILIQRLSSVRLRVHLGLGRQDRFGHGHELLADALPADATDIVDGGHDWPTWRRLWGLFLDRFASSAGAPAATPDVC